MHDRAKGPALGSPPRKGGKEHAMPCHHHLENYLKDYLDAAGIAGDREGAVFRTAVGWTAVLRNDR